jgi:excisionase family DNA binding protein
MNILKILLLLLLLALLALLGLGPDLSIRAAADELGVDEKSVRNWLAKGYLNGYRIGERVVRIRREDIEAAKRPYGGNGAA